jgi:hypothetical protein
MMAYGVREDAGSLEMVIERRGQESGGKKWKKLESFERESWFICT